LQHPLPISSRPAGRVFVFTQNNSLQALYKRNIKQRRSLVPKGIAETPALALTREDLLIEVDRGEPSGMLTAPPQTPAQGLCCPTMSHPGCVLPGPPTCQSKTAPTEESKLRRDGGHSQVALCRDRDPVTAARTLLCPQTTPQACLLGTGAVAENPAAAPLLSTRNWGPQAGVKAICNQRQS